MRSISGYDLLEKYDKKFLVKHKTVEIGIYTKAITCNPRGDFGRIVRKSVSLENGSENKPAVEGRRRTHLTARR